MYEPYPVPEQVREQKLSRYSSLWTFAKQDLRLLLFFLIIAGLVGLGIGYFWSCIFIAFVVFLHFSCVLYIWSMTGLPIIHTMSLEPQRNLGALLFNVYRAQRQERIVQAEMVGLIDRAQSSLVALAEAVVLIDDQHQIEWWNPAAERLLELVHLTVVVTY